jgi:calcium-dependent protein kinase
LSKKYYNDHDHVRGMKQFLGTPGFVAPEIQRTNIGEMPSYGSEVDVWSIGVITFCLLSGKMPFKRKGHDCVSLTSKMNRSYQRHYKEKKWKHKISQGAKEFLDAVLDPDPHERMSVSRLLTHNWFATSKDNDWGDDSAALQERASSLSDDSDYDAELLKRMQYFAKADKVEKAAMTILAISLHQEDILNLRKLFVEIDSENDGRISWQDLSKVIREGHADKITKTNIHELFHSIVTDGHGEESLSYTEFLAATMDHNLLHSKNRLKEAFKLVDKNNVGYINLSHFEALFKNTPAHETDQISAMIRERSKGDDCISFEMFCSILDDHHSNNVKSFVGQ